MVGSLKRARLRGGRRCCGRRRRCRARRRWPRWRGRNGWSARCWCWRRALLVRCVPACGSAAAEEWSIVRPACGHAGAPPSHPPPPDAGRHSNVLQAAAWRWVGRRCTALPASRASARAVWHPHPHHLPAPQSLPVLALRRRSARAAQPRLRRRRRRIAAGRPRRTSVPSRRLGARRPDQLLGWDRTTSANTPPHPTPPYLIPFHPNPTHSKMPHHFPPHPTYQQRGPVSWTLSAAPFATD
jgi:hypothetical protein